MSSSFNVARNISARTRRLPFKARDKTLFRDNRVRAAIFFLPFSNYHSCLKRTLLKRITCLYNPFTSRSFRHRGLRTNLAVISRVMQRPIRISGGTKYRVLAIGGEGGRGGEREVWNGFNATSNHLSLYCIHGKMDTLSILRKTRGATY